MTTNPANPDAIQRHARFCRLNLQARRLTNSTALRKSEFLRKLLIQSKKLEGDDLVKCDALLDVIQQYVTTIDTVSLLNLCCLRIKIVIYIRNFR